jgi:hypothetical protein
LGVLKIHSCHTSTVDYPLDLYASCRLFKVPN